MASDYEAITADNIRNRGEKFDDIGRFLAEQLYSDQTHFVYELLQNAQDALKRRTLSEPGNNFPKSVFFSLFPDRLELRHYGQEFNENDVKGISDILRGTKTKDTSQIGRFGIGFKSVYAFTESPEVHSGDENFVIERYIRLKETQPRIIKSGETLFIFPFNHQQKNSVETFERIQGRMADLRLRTLLFLDEIEQIVWDISGKRSGAYIREKNQIRDGIWKITLLGEEGSKTTEENFLIFQQGVEDLDTTVEIAFKLGKDEKTQKETIEPIFQSSLYAYFDTQKETGLKFLIQGHYQTTPSRDNVLVDVEFNKKLIIQTGKLLVHALEEFKFMGLLNANTLEAMPLKSEHFPPGSFFRPIFEAFRHAMETLALLPAYGVGYIKADEAKLARGSELIQLLPPESLRALFGFKSNYQWLSDDITRDKTPDLREFLMKTLEVEEIDPERFARQISETFLESQSDSWIIKFYEFLDSQKALWRTKPSWSRDSEGLLRRKPIIRTSDDQMVIPFDENDNPKVFLPTSDESNFPIVKKNIFEHKGAKSFLINLGLREPDLIDEVLKFVLPKYELGNNKINDDVHLLDLKKIKRALETKFDSQKEIFVNILKNTNFIRAINAGNGEKEFKKPTEIYIDNDQLRCYFDGNPDIWFYDVFLYASYKDLIIELGASSSIRMNHHREKTRFNIIYDGAGIHWRGIDGFDPEWDIEGLSFAIKNINFERAKFMWDVLLRPNTHLICGEVERSTKKGYSNSNKRFEESKAGSLVRHNRWLPDKNGEFRIPEELTLDDLHESLFKDEELAKKLGMRAGTLKAVASDLGMDEHTLYQIIELYKSDPASVKTFLSEKFEKPAVDSESDNFNFIESLQETFEKPEEEFGEFEETLVDTTNLPVQNPERRRGKIQEEILVSILNELESNQRFRRIPSVVWEKKDNRVRSFLLNQYNGHCQICGKTFPKRNGVHYFEGLYLVSRIHSQWIDRPGNVICLCPTCCAKFQHGKVKTEEVVGQIMDYKMIKEGGSGQCGIIVELCGEEVEIIYTESHMMDLQEIIKTANLNEEKE